MKRTQKTVAILLMAALSVALFSSCGEKPTENSSDSTSSTTTPLISEKWWKGGQPEKKIYFEGDLEGTPGIDFVDKEILVTLNEEKTWEKYVYTQEDFPGIEIEKIEDHYLDKKRWMVKQIKVLEELGLYHEDYEVVNANLRNLWEANEWKVTESLPATVWELEKYQDHHAWLTITIKKSGKRNLLRAIKELEKLSYVLCADPNHIFSLH